MTAIDVTPVAREWIADRGGAVALRVRAHYGCCGGSAGVVEAELGTPDDLDRFDRQAADGITIYLDREMAPTTQLRVLLEGVWRFRRLFVEGAELVGSRAEAHESRQK